MRGGAKSPKPSLVARAKLRRERGAYRQRHRAWAQRVDGHDVRIIGSKTEPFRILSTV